MAVLVDMIHGGCPACAAALLQRNSDSPLFVLRGDSRPGSEALPGPRSSRVHVLDSGSTAECLYRLKQSLDQLDLSAIRVYTSPRGREVLLQYQQLLFTAVYSFQYREAPPTCPRCAGPAHSCPPRCAGPAHSCPPRCAGPAHSRPPALEVQEDVSRFLQQLPPSRGHISVLKSTLIPECFGHGFSTRSGGVSYIPTLSSLNLFSSSKRRDPVAVVSENKRRLALHAGFHPLPLRFVKVDHANDVWVLGQAEPESYDSMVTDQSGVVLTAPGADCMPILFADPVKRVIGAAHAGWRGTLMGVARRTVDAMVAHFDCQVSNIVVAVGPSVGVCCFTLDREQALDFIRVHPDCVPDPESAKPHVNIRLANRVLLQEGGVLPENIHDHLVAERPSVTPCTSCLPEDFFSHVRDGLNFGTQVGFLWIKETAEQTASTVT